MEIVSSVSVRVMGPVIRKKVRKVHVNNVKPYLKRPELLKRPLNTRGDGFDAAGDGSIPEEDEGRWGPGGEGIGEGWDLDLGRTAEESDGEGSRRKKNRGAAVTAHLENSGWTE